MSTMTNTCLGAVGMMFSLIIGDTTDRRSASDLLATVDHLVYATPDLDKGIEKLESEMGVRATTGGAHPGRGTRNALIALGPTSYLEIIGPDPAQPTPPKPRTFGIDSLDAPRLVRWAAKGTELEQLAAKARASGIDLGEVLSGSRQRTDGVLLSWRYTDPTIVVADGIVPFFIDWGRTDHPARTAAAGATLISLRAEHPAADRVRSLLGQLGIDLQVDVGPKPALIATIDAPRGRVELR